MTKGSLSLLGQAGPFLFTIEDKARPDAVQAAAAKDITLAGSGSHGPTTVVAADRKGKALADGGPAQLAEVQTFAPKHGSVPQVLLSDSDSLPDLNEPAPPSPARKKKAATITYRRRSPRIQKLQDGVRMDSVERASSRKATVDGVSDSSLASAATRRRKTKTKRIPDIKDIAPLPVTSTPPEMSRQTLMDLAGCCGITMDMVDVALKDHEAEASSGKAVTHG
jgi:hypothetical protein